jgi:thymidylate synthase (FAD)
MKVDILATTMVDGTTMQNAYGYPLSDPEYNHSAPTPADALGEAAGRLCYKSFRRPNPATASNDGYMLNILRQGHYSVLEHSSASFLVRGVSRALLAELSRHRHLSFSVVSQRYVSYSDTEPVIPPAAEGTPAETAIANAYADALKRYEWLVEDLTARGLKRKQAREAARSVLPNAAPVDMVVTGNLRAWRDVLGKRWHDAADAEIKEFAGLVLGHLRSIAPNSFQDVPETPYAY